MQPLFGEKTKRLTSSGTALSDPSVSTLQLKAMLICRKNLYWRYDDVKRQMDPGYPHDLSRWRGVPSDIDAAMQWTDGKQKKNSIVNNHPNPFLNIFNLKRKNLFF